MRSLHWVFVACVFSSAACGPDELPGFANPPPEPDAGLAKDAGHAGHAGHAGSDGNVDEDAGTSNDESS